jgi:hypothetical protein
MVSGLYNVLRTFDFIATSSTIPYAYDLETENLSCQEIYFGAYCGGKHGFKIQYTVSEIHVISLTRSNEQRTNIHNFMLVNTAA